MFYERRSSLIRDPSQIVRSGLARLLKEAESFEVGSGLVRRTEVDLPSTVNDQNFVETFVNVLRSLVKRNKCRGLVDVGKCA